MYLSELSIENFRILDNVQLTLDQQTNLLRGPNGAGKTAVLEALHLLATGRSFRSGGARGLIRHGESTLRVRARLHSGTWLAIERSTTGGFRARRGSDTVHRISDLARELPLQVLLPDAAELVFGGPAERRSAMDWGLFHVEHGFRDLSRDYALALRQRNSLLRKSQLGGVRPDVELEPWSARVAELGEQITTLRVAYVDRLNPLFAETLLRLSPELDLSVDYQPGFEPGSLGTALGADVLREVKLGSTRFGPHRAELRIRRLDRLAGSVLSRGQGKIAAFALRLAQAQDLLQRTGIAPVFLVDDVGAELDHEHNERLFGLLQSLQSQVLATTALDQLPWGTGWQLFHVKQGEVERLVTHQ